jgi:two-component system CheB/CheR fusion protein
MNPCRVLIIDDCVDGARLLAHLLHLWGHETRCAFDGRSGLELAEEFRPDIVLCDVAMPGMSGCEVAKRLLLKPDMAKVLVVAVTAYGTEQDRFNTREAGFHMHLVKPVEPSILQGILAQALNPDRLDVVSAV